MGARGRRPAVRSAAPDVRRVQPVDPVAGSVWLISLRRGSGASLRRTVPLPRRAAGQSLKGRNMGRASKRLCGNRRGVQVDRVATGWKAVAPIDAGPLEQVAIMRAYSAGRG